MQTNTPQYLMSFLCLRAAAADGKTSAAELDYLESFLTGLLEGVGEPTPVRGYLAELLHTLRVMPPEEVASDTERAIGALKLNVPPGVLAQLANQMEHIAGADGLHRDEARFLYGLRATWGISA